MLDSPLMLSRFSDSKLTMLEALSVKEEEVIPFPNFSFTSFMERHSLMLTPLLLLLVKEEEVTAIDEFDLVRLGPPTPPPVLLNE